MGQIECVRPQLVLMQGGGALPRPWRSLAPRDAGAGRAPRLDPSGLEPGWAHRAGHGKTADRWRRAADIVLALVVLVLAFPAMALSALLVRVDSPGPVLYRQERVGLHGRPFTLLKFRSMRTDAEHGVPVWAAERDPRVTRVGAVLRRFRLDETPQLFNVLRGDMAMVGPRPERPHFVEQLAQAIPSYAERHRVKPGLTGWAQVNYPYGASVEDARVKLMYDLYYLENRCPALDARILLATVRVVVSQAGAR